MEGLVLGEGASGRGVDKVVPVGFPAGPGKGDKQLLSGREPEEKARFGIEKGVVVKEIEAAEVVVDAVDFVADGADLQIGEPAEAGVSSRVVLR